MTKKILLIITVFAFIVRLIYCQIYPPMLWDEASLGYNAYSILKTGHDEYGKFLPYIFKSFGDYKPGLYVYLTVPFVAFFGLNTLSVRLPSIVLGSFIPLLLYLLILKLSPNSKKIAIISAILVAINPWNIHYSRGAWETNVLLFELILGCYLYLKPKYFLSALVFGTTLYTYQGGKMMSPLLIIILFCLNYTQVFTKKNILSLVIPLFIISLPIFLGLIFQNDSNRLQVFGLWSYHRPNIDTQQIIQESNNTSYQIFHNDTIYIIRNFFTRYFNHFSPKYLAFIGDWQIGRQSAPYIGVLLFPTYLLFIFGFFKILGSKLSNINKFFLLWLLVSPLPAALTLDIIQPVRTLSMSIPLIYFASVGAEYILNWKLYGTYILIISFLFSFVYYGDLYLNHMVKVKPDHWLYGYQAAMDYAVKHAQGKEVTFTDYYGQPYIYYLFQSKYDPAKYQQQSNLISSGLDIGRVAKIDNFKFSTPQFDFLKNRPHTLGIYSMEEITRQNIDTKLMTPLSPINGHSSFYAYETN